MKPIIFALLFNYWIFILFSTNFFVGLLVLILTFYVYKFFKSEKRKLTKPLLVFFLFTLLFQSLTTQEKSLTIIENDDRREIDMRLKAYTPKFLRVGYWFEERKESIAFTRVSSNFFENIDPNLYFFANHPREKVGVKEIEKFPYILLPVFLIGLVEILKRKYVKFWLISFFVPLVFLSFIGNINPMGPFILFPFFVITISEGFGPIARWLEKKPKYVKFFIYILFILIFIQGFAYEIY